MRVFEEVKRYQERGFEIMRCTITLKKQVDCPTLNLSRIIKKI